MADTPPRPTTNDDREGWKAYWAAQGMPWRTEPEIDEKRQRFLAKRRAVKPDIEKGIYPFRDENGGIKLTRADVEWLVAHHDIREPFPSPQGLVLFAHAGPDGTLWQRRGPNLCGAGLDGVNLVGLPLEFGRLDHASLVRANLDSTRLGGAYLDGAVGTGATLRRANLDSSSLCDTMLVDADLSGAQLVQAYLRGTDLRRANLRDANLAMAKIEDARFAGADLTGACLNDTCIVGGSLNGIRIDPDTAADLLGTIIASMPGELPDVEWAELPLARIEWSRLFRLAEDFIAYWEGALAGDYQVYVSPPKTLESEHVKACRVLARSYQRLAAIWSEHDMQEYAPHLVKRAERLRQGLIRRGADPDYEDQDIQP